MQQSWVFGANDPELGRGLNHLPYTVFVDPATDTHRIGVGIGACVLDLAAASDALPTLVRDAVRQPRMNVLMGLGPVACSELRSALQHLLSRENRDRTLLESALLPARGLQFVLPCQIGDYTDFYASRDHARRVGELFRPDQPLLANYDWVPIAYHGRASSIVASGAPVRRPSGQLPTGSRPTFAPTQRLDYELELGFWVGAGNALGEPVPVGQAGRHLFGVSLLNDWTARDIQRWEYQPLGPFLAKNFCTSVSPWITPMAALEGLRATVAPHDGGTLDYLVDAHDQALGGIALQLEVALSTAASRAAGLESFALSKTNSRSLFWTPAQMLAHHTSGGCNLRPGDLLGTGTISGAMRDEAGCLLERTSGGAEPIYLPNGERRTFLEDGDEVTLSGWGQPAAGLPIRLGDCHGRIHS